MGEGVAKTYKKAFSRRLRDAVEDYLDVEDAEFTVSAVISEAEKATGEVAKLQSSAAYIAAVTEGLIKAFKVDQATAEKLVKRAAERAYKKTDRDTQQAMEGFVHNLNTMHSRAGAQTPFSSINYGTDTTPEGRMVIKNILLALDAGMGHGETCIFPIHIFKVKEGRTLYEVKVPAAPTAYLECSFHSNPDEAKWIIENVEAIGEAIAHGICDYFKVEYVPTVVEKKQIVLGEFDTIKEADAVLGQIYELLGVAQKALVTLDAELHKAVVVDK
jgi:anaerobic ribonucleoside-triphosphate reductase